jgi:hypothetical protein
VSNRLLPGDMVSRAPRFETVGVVIGTAPDRKQVFVQELDVLWSDGEVERVEALKLRMLVCARGRVRGRAAR